MKLQSLLLALALALPLPALAHGKLDSADPADGAVLDTAPTTLSLSFTENLELALAKVTLTDAAGGVIATPAPEAEGGDTRHLRVALPTLPAGVYKVEWNVTSVDTHNTHGSYSFAVK